MFQNKKKFKLIYVKISLFYSEIILSFSCVENSFGFYVILLRFMKDTYIPIFY